MNKIKIIFFLMPVILVSCFFQKKCEINDFKTEGFLSDNCYQILIKVKPDENLQGLVNQRESAYIKAKNSMNNYITNNLVKYYINTILTEKNNKLNLIKIEKYLKKEFKEYYDLGYPVFEYYDEDNAIIIIYRLHKSGLRDKISSIKIPMDKL